MKTNWIIRLITACGLLTLTSCLPLAAGAATGYVAHKEGYRVQSPVTKE